MITTPNDLLTINQLRAELKAVKSAKGIDHMVSSITRLVDERNALRAELERVKAERVYLDATIKRLNTDNSRISKDGCRMLLVIAEMAQAMGIHGSTPHLEQVVMKAVKQLAEDNARRVLGEVTG